MCLTPLNGTILNHSRRRKEACSYLERRIASTVCWGICHLNQCTLVNISAAQSTQHKGSMYRYTAHTGHAMEPPLCLLSYCLQEEKRSQVKWNDLDTIMFNMVAQVKHMGGRGGGVPAVQRSMSFNIQASITVSLFWRWWNKQNIAVNVNIRVSLSNNNTIAHKVRYSCCIAEGIILWFPPQDVILSRSCKTLLRSSFCPKWQWAAVKHVHSGFAQTGSTGNVTSSVWQS